MDQFSAHLDRGWDLVQRGDARGAEASARRALELDASSPEAHNLLGFAAALQGENEEALEAYKQAIALDDTYMEAMLNAAELYIHPLGDFDQAISLCDQALELAEVDEEIIEALLLKCDALLGKGDLDAAKEVLRKLPDGPYENANHAFLIGRALYETGDATRAQSLIEAALAKEPMHGEAHYYLGRILDEREDNVGATQAFVRARALDLQMGMPPWTPSPEAFNDIAKRAVEALNPVLRRYIDNAAVYVTDVPGLEVVTEGVDPRAVVLLDGFVSDEGGFGLETHPCTRVFIYALNVARLAGSADGLEREITQGLEREITATFLEAEQSERTAKELN